MTKKVIETVNGWYMENPKQKVELDDIVGLVKTGEPTDSVQLKKEAQLSIYEKRIIELEEENEQLKFENNELKCALALDAVDYIIADGKKIDIPPYYEFEQRYDHVIHRKEYDGYD